MTQRAYVGKSRKTLPVSAFQRDKTWRKLFDNASNYQTVLATMFPNVAEYPIAGVGLQVGLEQYPEQWREHYEQQLADTLSKMRGRPFDRERLSSTRFTCSTGSSITPIATGIWAHRLAT